MNTKGQSLYDVMRQIRTGFNLLKTLADTLHADLGVTASMRAVMETVSERAQTVPEIAALKHVSRQHIQVNVDALLDLGMVTLEPNPAHKRSPLVTLSPSGKKLFAEIRQREARVLKQLADKFNASELAETANTLAHLNQQLSDLNKTENDHDD